MALQAVTAVAVHAATFRNVDLPHQGLYHLCCCLYQCRDDRLAPCVPHILPPERDTDIRALLPARLASGTEFQTKSVFIRFSDEEAVLDDIVQFHIEREPSSSQLQLQLEVKLMYADLCDGELPVGDLDDASRADVALPRVPPSKLFEVQFQELSKKTFRLRGAAEHMHAYCPCVFEENYFCNVGIMVHSSLLDFRLRFVPAALPLSPYARPASKLAQRLPADAAACCTSRDRACADPSGSPGGFRPASLADDLVRLARGAAPSRSNDTTELPRAAEDAPESRLAAAVDFLQRRYVGRLAEARQGLVDFLQAVPRHHPGSPGPEAASSPRKSGTSSLEASVDLKFKRFQPPGRGTDFVPLSGRFGNNLDAPVFATKLAEDLSDASSQVLEVWTTLLRALSFVREDITDFLYQKWEKEMMKCWSERVFRVVHPVSDVASPNNGRAYEERRRAAEELRALQGRGGAGPGIEDSAQTVLPVLFEQRYMRDGGKHEATSVSARSDVAGCLFSPSDSSSGTPRRRRPAYAGIHVFILVHGFQGCSFDMRLIKSCVSALFPTVLCLCSEANEDDTEGDIGQMGALLASEVRAFVHEWCPGGLAGHQTTPRGPSLGRLSFICHSVGGLIARAALPLLALEFGAYFYTFMSFSSPHLGYMYAHNSMFKTGLWLAAKMRNSVCLEQLSMNDSPDPRGLFLLELSRQGGLSDFRHVVLLASHQDQYAPFESARLEMADGAKKDSPSGNLYTEMLQNILGPLQPDRIIRFDIDFGITEVSLDSVIGRAAHIHFIESQELMKMLTHMYPFLFE